METPIVIDYMSFTVIINSLYSFSSYIYNYTNTPVVKLKRSNTFNVHGMLPTVSYTKDRIKLYPQ